MTKSGTTQIPDNDTFIAADPVGVIETSILNNVKNGGASPHQKIIGRQKLAELLGTTHHRVRQAIRRLEDRGLVYTRKGSGVYLTEKALDLPPNAGNDSVSATASSSETISNADADEPFSVFSHVPIFKTLRVQVLDLLGDNIQVRMWRNVFEAFKREYPFVNLELEYSRDQAGSCDVAIMPWAALGDNLSAQRPLDPRMLAQGGFDPDTFTDHVLNQGRMTPEGELFGLPLLRTTTVLAVNRRLFKQYGVRVESFEHPSDWYRAGFTLQEKSGGQISSFNYSGFHFHGTFYGMEFRKQAERWLFDRARMAQLLEDLKPFIRRDQLSTKWDIDRFYTHSRGICCCYLHNYPWMVRRMNKAADFVRLPLEPGGFVTESGFIGVVPVGSVGVEEAAMLLGFIASEKGQAALVAENPEWLSVNRAVLARQKANSPFPEGSVIYECDPRNVMFPREHPLSCYTAQRPRMETEAAKFYLGMQGLEQTLERMMDNSAGDLSAAALAKGVRGERRKRKGRRGS